ncbi:unnamed protein product [Polarella glacialis]|uniref:Uncharacterized protein n=1 Tax=Polarella glacialis TaxID=89957 RepID=A0A813H9N8_POLGL|nr:unnamed protein product [Polarella glacialis]
MAGVADAASSLEANASSQLDSEALLSSSAGGCSENQGFLRACGTQCYSNPARASCAGTCLRHKGVQHSCASCQGAKIDCTISKCLTPCAASANGHACRTCVRSHCRSCGGAGAFLDEAAPTGLFEEAVMAGVAEAASSLEANASSQLDSEALLSSSAGGCSENQGFLRACGTQCYSNPARASCASTCLRRKGVQHSCASCQGAKIDCTISKCLTPCAASANGHACRTCVRSHCRSCGGAGAFLDAAAPTGLFEEAVMAGVADAASSLEANASSQLDSEALLSSSAGGCSENQGFLKACGTQCYSNPARASCAGTCLRHKGVQHSCASCQGAKIDCTISKCLTPCAASANGHACRTCVRSHCRSCGGAGAFLDAAAPTGLFEEAVMAGVADAASSLEANASSQLDSEALLSSSAGGCSENQGFLRACGTQCYSNPARASCASTCLRRKGVQHSCASCQGAKIDCTISKCLTPCAASANGHACRTCVRSHCRSCGGAGAFLDAAAPTGLFEEAVMAGVADATNLTAATEVASESESQSLVYP